jgi:hypothetical protein
MRCGIDRVALQGLFTCDGLKGGRSDHRLDTCQRRSQKFLLHFKGYSPSIAFAHKGSKDALKVHAPFSNGKMQIVGHAGATVIVMEVHVSNRFEVALDGCEGGVDLGQELAVSDVQSDAEARNSGEHIAEIVGILGKIL